MSAIAPGEEVVMRRVVGKRRLLGTAGLAVALALPTALPVAAAGPVKEPVVADPFVLEGACDFPVLIEPINVKAHNKTFLDASGNLARVLVNGHFELRLTNQANGTSITVGSSGPVTITPTADGEHWVQRGVGVWWAFDGEPSGPDLWLSVGRIEVDFDADFALLSIDRTNRDRPLCPELAGP